MSRDHAAGACTKLTKAICMSRALVNELPPARFGAKCPAARSVRQAILQQCNHSADHGPCMLTRLTVLTPVSQVACKQKCCIRTQFADRPLHQLLILASLCRPALRPRCRPDMVRTRRAEDLECGDARLDSSPSPPSAASCASCASWNSEPQPVEEFLLQCTDQDHEAELRLMQLREKRETPAQTWLVPEGHQKVLSAKHRRFLVGWLLTVSFSQHLSTGLDRYPSSKALLPTFSNAAIIALKLRCAAKPLIAMPCLCRHARLSTSH